MNYTILIPLRIKNLNCIANLNTTEILYYQYKMLMIKRSFKAIDVYSLLKAVTISRILFFSLTAVNQICSITTVCFNKAQFSQVLQCCICSIVYLVDVLVLFSHIRNL